MLCAEKRTRVPFGASHGNGVHTFLFAALLAAADRGGAFAATIAADRSVDTDKMAGGAACRERAFQPPFGRGGTQRLLCLLLPLGFF